MFEDNENNTTNEIRESYHDYMGRRMREEDAKMQKENALNNAQRSIWAVSYTHLTLPTNPYV